MSVVDKFIARAKDNPARIVYPEATDPRILQAVVQVKEQGIEIGRASCRERV